MAKKLKVSKCVVGKRYRTVYGKYVQVMSITSTAVKLHVAVTDNEITVEPTYVVEEIEGQDKESDIIEIESKKERAKSEEDIEENEEELEESGEEEDEEDLEEEDEEELELEEDESDDEEDEEDEEDDDLPEEEDLEDDEDGTDELEEDDSLEDLVEETEVEEEEPVKAKKVAKRKTKTKETKNVIVKKRRVRVNTAKQLIIRMCKEKECTLDELTKAVMEAGLTKSQTEEKTRKSIGVSINLMRKDGVNIQRVGRGIYRVIEDQ